MPALALTPTLRVLSLFFPSVTNTSLKTSFTKWMQAKTQAHADAKERSTRAPQAPEAEPTKPPVREPIARPVGPSDFLPDNIDELNFIDARNAAWTAFQEWQAHKHETEAAEKKKTAQACAT